MLQWLIYVTEEFEEHDDDDDDDDWDSGSETGGASGAQDLCLPALRYLQQCCAILASMWNMPACPIFTGAQRSAK